MKVFVDIGYESRAISRVVNDLKLFAPSSVTIVDRERDADLVVLHVIGRRDAILRRVDELCKLGKRFAVIQYCLRSTKNPNTSDWFDIWCRAQVVWSYYDLPALIAEDKDETSFSLLNFYDAPLGVHFEVFHEQSLGQRPYVIATNGSHRLTESIRECKIAADVVDRPMFHVGNYVNGLGKNVEFASGISDLILMLYYNQCEFVAGLRRIEGFEYGVVEGALCGARPICFDAPHYRRWFGDFAEFIPEGPREAVVEDLIRLFRRGAKPVSPEEMFKIAERFSPKTIVDNFWKRL